MNALLIQQRRGSNWLPIPSSLSIPSCHLPSCPESSPTILSSWFWGRLGRRRQKSPLSYSTRRHFVALKDLHWMKGQKVDSIQCSIFLKHHQCQHLWNKQIFICTEKLYSVFMYIHQEAIKECKEYTSKQTAQHQSDMKYLIIPLD